MTFIQSIYTFVFLHTFLAYKKIDLNCMGTLLIGVNLFSLCTGDRSRTFLLGRAEGGGGGGGSLVEFKFSYNCLKTFHLWKDEMRPETPQTLATPTKTQMTQILRADLLFGFLLVL